MWQACDTPNFVRVKPSINLAYVLALLKYCINRFWPRHMWGDCHSEGKDKTVNIGINSPKSFFKFVMVYFTCRKGHKTNTITSCLRDCVMYWYGLCYLLSNWLAYLFEHVQSLRPDVMHDQREGITRAAGFGLTHTEMLAS